MSRLPPLDPETLSDRQKEVYAAIAAGPRGSVRGPFPAWIRSPELADRGQSLGEFLRFNTAFEPRLAELAIIICARFWTAQYEWYAHARLARQGGLSDAVIDAVARRERPDMADDEAAVYDFCQELHRDHNVSDATYQRVVDRFGERGVVELIGISGYYTMVSMTLNVANVQLPEGETGLAP
ncbi:MAG: carboxymuconolactone decarboxylase family protein [Alphaproteobacteria bacterium]|nr:carboxymuconolactone decarboxylase family protein [Alphaproteobacteria bacterium]MCB9929099.1 carboxymuconolactone decarboxylase family protein [Alphaproteobacteria bacterium]